MIITVTLNAALDRTLVASGFTVGRSLTVAPAHVQAGGKGINVARALRALGAPCHALGFAGGFTGAMMRHALAAEGLAHELIPIDAESRTCTAIVDPDRGVATEVNESGPAIAAAER
ncbi:MAG TPA: PfkB family carbohydrate kinase, partial [Chloroflexota bacterium]|nr:PfkB family carbohydrate kinase [Chloroflexota bacterium]